MKRIAICVKTLAALLNIAGKDDVRDCINGVLLEPVGDNSIRYVATNGNVVSLRQVESPILSDSESPDGIAPLVIPREALERLKLSRHVDTGYLVIHDAVQTESGTPKPRECVVEYQGVAIQFQEVDGRFPSYRKVVRVTFSGEAAQFDPALLSMIEKAARQIIGNKASNRISVPVIAHNGQSGVSGFAVAEAELYGSIMPFNGGEFAYPEWMVAEVAKIIIEDQEKELEAAKEKVYLGDRIPACEARITAARTALTGLRVSIG